MNQCGRDILTKDILLNASPKMINANLINTSLERYGAIQDYIMNTKNEKKNVVGIRVDPKQNRKC